jgi:hypothetical protein
MESSLTQYNAQKVGWYKHLVLRLVQLSLVDETLIIILRRVRRISKSDC